ncbi:MAG: hypothetical protein ACJA2S_002888 [Cyclobacteriaceae bacterium]|jgi:hypothetical protein
MKLMNRIWITTICLGFIFLSSCSSKKEIDFNSQVRPILNNNCLGCHGGVKKQSDLSFLFMEDALLPAKSGKLAIIPGDADGSELIRRVMSLDPEVVMPPEDHRLNEQEVGILKDWIDQGAKSPDHWVYVPSDPNIAPPKVESEWDSNEIDQFVFAKLQKEGLEPSELAEKTTLIRRLSLDLIGLPPTIDETNQFISDNDPNAYDKLVDRLLESKHFGERWAAVWLDLARYADSKGYQKDKLRKDIWRYRDWVIDAFNKDMPFDQFTIEQLAGDLLPNATDDQILSTAFHRNTMTNDEGGTDDEEFRVAAVIDRLNTSFEIWQGTTIGCVQCHSHPFDPIRHEEFYELYAFFNNTTDHDSGKDSPLRQLYSPDQLNKRNSLEQKLKSFEQSGDTVSSAYQSQLETFLKVKPGMVQVMEEMPADSSRETKVFIRGNWLMHGDVVTPDTPGHLPPMSDDYPKNRLGFAKWLVDGNNPVTARVIVNRFWEQMFGSGLVTTVEDVGTQGQKPSHPELLDWLSNQFANEYKWSVKSLLKTIVLSSTYRQSSKVTPELLEKDPANYLLARGSRYRLSAEAIRDQALVISGLFNPESYGPSVMPFQPDGVWNVIRHVDRWEKDTLGNQHRRALYTFWRRVSPYPSMMTFDAPSRELCVSRRIRTNTPLQALVTLNDPVYVEASEALADRMTQEGGETTASQIEYGFQLALMRPPNEERLKYLLEFYESTKEKYRETNTDAGEEFLERQAMINVANVLLNLDEVVMKG